MARAPDLHGQRALRACMQALVLLNLVFVQMTGAARLAWLFPLFALTLGAPLLRRHHERRAYRLLWNAGVVCFFLVLLRHALRADLASVLEDGLVMAVLCQVHLLNNLRSSQRPDLLFFNAFLIATITGFTNRGVGFLLAFLAFAPCFVVGLQLLSATRGGHALSRSVTRRLVIDGGRRAGILLVLSLLVFLFWPRDFERKAFFSGKFDMSSSRTAELEIGFNEELVLDRSAPVVGSDRKALRVTLLEGDSSDVSTLWRGATLSSTSGGAWHSMEPATRRAAAIDERWQGRWGQLVRPGTPAANAPRVEVVRYEQETERLFAPLGARALQLGPEHATRLLRPRLDGTIDSAQTGEVRYELTLAPASEVKPGGARAEDVPKGLVPYVELPASPRIERARELADRLAARLPSDAEQRQLVALLSDHLARTFTYLPPGTEGAASTLDEFLRGGAGGHCEFFASALATMLRSLDIPCRVVTGFRSTDWDAEGRVLAFGMRNAHAWVEVHDPRAGWYAVDPSPILVGQAAGTSLWARLQSSARSAWEKVTNFDSERRAEFFAWIRTLPRRIGSAFRQRPLGSSFMLLLLLLPIALVAYRRRTSTQPAVRVYRRALRRARLRPLSGETPRELLARARTQGLRPERVLELEAATRRHEAERYAA